MIKNYKHKALEKVADKMLEKYDIIQKLKELGNTHHEKKQSSYDKKRDTNEVRSRIQK